MVVRVACVTLGLVLVIVRGEGDVLAGGADEFHVHETAIRVAAVERLKDELVVTEFVVAGAFDQDCRGLVVGCR